VCTQERVRAEHESQVLLRDIEITAVNYVLPDQTALLRMIAVKNISLQPTEQIFWKLLNYVCPAGLCGEYYDLASPVPRVQRRRDRNGEIGVNADAVLYFLTRFEPDT